MLDEDNDIELKIEIFFYPFGVKVVTSKGKKNKRKEHKFDISWATKEDNDDDYDAFPSHPLISGIYLEVVLDVVRRLIEHAHFPP